MQALNTCSLGSEIYRAVILCNSVYVYVEYLQVSGYMSRKLTWLERHFLGKKYVPAGTQNNFLMGELKFIYSHKFEASWL